MENRLTAPNLARLYQKAAEQYDALPAFATRKARLNWDPVSFRELYERGLDLATGLIGAGVSAREHVGLFGDNRLEWILADYGIQLSGAVNVPRGSDITDNELIYIINHAEIRIAFVETESLLKTILRLKPELECLREIILLAPEAEQREGIRMLEDVIKSGAELRAGGNRKAEDRIAGIDSDDLFTLIYTSGTTGKPKGVMLTHANMMSQTKAIPIRLTCTDRVLSILPVWHIFERVFEVYTISCGACTYYSSVRTLGEDMVDVEPTFMGSAPRLWESLYQRILKRVRESHPVRRALFRIAYYLSSKYKESVFYLSGNYLQLEPEPALRRLFRSQFHAVRWMLLLPWYGFFNAAVLEPVRQSAGGSLKATVSGGGALPVEIDRFFNFIGIPVLEGYGMTETSPVVAARLEDHLVIGTVGPPVPGTEIRIVDPHTEELIYPDQKCPDAGKSIRGEIWVRGPQVMKGYYRDEELTASTIREGWLRTGDLGMITYNHCLKILGRCKATVVLSSGENLEPEPIEMQLNQSPYIEYSMVVGQDQRQPAVLIVPRPEGFREIGIRSESLRELAENEEVKKIIRNEIRKMISRSNGYRPYEQIRDFRLVPERFSTGEELTSLYKLKRHVIEKKYSYVIREIYSQEPVNVR